MRVLEAKLKKAREALDACHHQFCMMADPYMPNVRHLSDPEDMAQMCVDALAALEDEPKEED